MSPTGSAECVPDSTCAPDGVGPDGGMCPATCGQLGLPCCGADAGCVEGTCLAGTCTILHMR